MTLAKITAGLLVVMTLSGTARGDPDVIATANTNNSWVGFYIGGNIGGAWNSTCDNWETANVATVNPLIVKPYSAFSYRVCPSSDGTFIGGAQIGYNFQYDQWVWGFGLDYEAYSGKDVSRSNTYGGTSPPLDGTYTFSGKNDPDGFLILGPRIGYAVDNWLPYFRFGGVFTSGSRHLTATFTPALTPTHPIVGVPAPTGPAIFQGGKDYDSSGYGVGFGIESAMASHWSLRAEYTYVNLGEGDNSITTCTGSSATCSAFGNIKLDNTHNSLTANLFRVGINYRV